MDACTIIAKNYLAYARVLARSFARHHPDGRFWTLIIDDFDGYIDPAQEPFEVVTPTDIGCEPFIHMAMRYSVLELSTAVKPWLLRHLMGKSLRPITYLDPDIKVYGSLQPLDDLAAAHGVVLIPHNNEPIPPDDRRPSQVDIMIAGIYNLGYVSLAPGREVEDLLDWWADRLERDCRVDPRWGYFVDQRWFDLAPGFLSDLAIVRDPEFNVAYWNVHSRRLGWEGGRYTVNGRALSFFHFSGFDPEQPLALSRYQDRIDVTGDRVLERLLGEYADDVIGDGHAVSRTWPYSYAALGNGMQIDDAVRGLYDEFADEHGGRVRSPFTLQGATEFEAWLREPVSPDTPSINRAIARVYATREDLRGAYPDLSGGDHQGLLRWATEYGQREVPLLARLMSDDGQGDAPPSRAAPRVAKRRPASPLRNAPWGVNLVGLARDTLGLGDEARRVVGALDAAGTAVLPIEAPPSHAAAQATFPVNLLCMDGDLVSEFVREAGDDFVAGRYSVGLWFWDAGTPPRAWLESLALLDELWAPSVYVARLLETVATVPVHAVRIPAQPHRLHAPSRGDAGLSEDRFLFCAGFEHRRGAQRADPLDAIAAFRQAFAPDEGPQLLLRCEGLPDDGDLRRQLVDAVGEHPDVELIGASTGLGDLIAMSDCYVSLHRAEAFGLPMAEAMWLGKPVIATGYSGNLDYMTPENSYLVRSRLVPIEPGSQHGPADGEWAQPDIEHAASRMRSVFDDPDAARQRGEKAAEEVRLTHSAQAAGELMHRRLEAIRATGRARLRADTTRHRPESLRALALKIRQGPTPVAGRGLRRSARSFARSVVLRAIRPYSAQQDRINGQLLAALDELNRGIDTVRQAAVGDRARQAGELRSFERLPALIESASVGVQQLKSALTLHTDRDIYLALAELRDRHSQITSAASDPPDPVGLTAYELRAFSQNGEDGVLAEILRRIGAANSFFVEFGVESGREGNCVYLADVAEWHGLFMEGGDEFFGQLENKYAAQERVTTLQAYVTQDNVEELFETGGVPLAPDVVSIDVDGQDYWIWSAIERYRPRVLVIEYNSRLDPLRRLVQPNEPQRPWDGTDYFGASLGALRALGEQKGYRLVHTELSGVNAFFVRDDLAGDSFPQPDRVAIRGTPNYFQSGYRHPSATAGRRYVDLDSGDLVDPDR